MIMMKSGHILFIISLVCCLACNESKYLAANERLYSANKVVIKSSVKISRSDSKAMTAELNDLLRPKLNSKILGGRFKLWVYNIAGTPKGKGLRYLLKNKIGEAPILSSGTLLEKNRDILQNHLENKGYFHDTVMLETPVKKKLLTAVYTAHIGPRYVIRNVVYPKDTDEISRVIDTLQKRSLLKKGAFFDLDVIKDERTRIDTRLKQKGYFYFGPDYLLVDADTSIGHIKGDSSFGKSMVDMRMIIKPETPLRAKQPYHIRNVIVYAQYDIHSDTGLAKAYTTPEGYRIIDTARIFRPIIFSRTLVFKPGALYKRNDHNLSLNRLVSLGVFRFVRARFEPVDTLGGDQLNAYYYLSPTKKKSIRFEASALTRSDNTTGGELSVTWRNRNLFRGAELFTASIYGGLEEQFIGAGQEVSTRRGGVNFNLFIPRIVGPFDWFRNSAFVPKTKIYAGYEIFDRTSQYQLNSAKASFGYIFKNKITMEHQLTLLGINYVRPYNIDSAYQIGLDTNITLARSIEKQFIIGPTYNFNYNSQAQPNHRRNNFYFNANLDLSGNLLGLFTGANISKGKEVELFNTPFAEYTRVELDFRHYLSFNKYNQFVSRITGGVGFSYGNSTTMPFIKEFFAGGTNDIRAFRSRALGPGTYYRGDPNTHPLLPDQPGDVKIEMNAEYRTRLFSIVRWALFVDAGNVWTLRADSTRPGSTFTSSFLKDIAVGVGTGLRFDINILVLRIDVAVPVRYPWLPEGQKWAFNKAADISKMVLNLAIGYPF
jgi:outer membrane protein insertion porin family